MNQLFLHFCSLFVLAPHWALLLFSNLDLKGTFFFLLFLAKAEIFIYWKCHHLLMLEGGGLVLPDLCKLLGKLLDLL